MVSRHQKERFGKELPYGAHVASEALQATFIPDSRVRVTGKPRNHPRWFTAIGEAQECFAGACMLLGSVCVFVMLNETGPAATASGTQKPLPFRSPAAPDTARLAKSMLFKRNLKENR